jgi:hypothetical protein
MPYRFTLRGGLIGSLEIDPEPPGPTLQRDAK